MTAKVIEIHLPEYDIKEKPNYIRLGEKVDPILASLPDGKYLIRAISSDDHEMSLNELVQVVLDTGTDKYDPERKGVCHDSFAGYNYDIQAGILHIKDGKIVLTDEEVPSVFGDFVYHFYEHTPLDRGYSLRLDLLTIYKIDHLEQAKKTDAAAPDVSDNLRQYLYRFKDAENKRAALECVVKITR